MTGMKQLHYAAIESFTQLKTKCQAQVREETSLKERITSNLLKVRVDE